MPLLLVVGMCLHCRSLHQWWQTHRCIRDYWNILWYLIFKLPVLFTHVMYAQMYVYNTLVPRPSHTFPSIACRTLAGEVLVYFLMWVMSQAGQIMQTWASCKSQTTSPTHILEHDYSESKDSSARRLFFVALHETVGRTSHASTVSRWCHPKLIYSLS